MLGTLLKGIASNDTYSEPYNLIYDFTLPTVQLEATANELPL